MIDDLMASIPDSFHLPGDIARILAERLRELRLHNGWKRATLAVRSGVTEASLKRFERTGKVSLENLLKLCHALGRLQEFDGLLIPPVARTLAELEKRQSKPLPKWGRK